MFHAKTQGSAETGHALSLQTIRNIPYVLTLRLSVKYLMNREQNVQESETTEAK